MSKARKTIAIAMAAAMSLGLCASAYAANGMSTTVTGNAALSTLEETSAQPGETPTEAYPGAGGGSAADGHDCAGSRRRFGGQHHYHH